jgi:hypothetical protein
MKIRSFFLCSAFLFATSAFAQKSYFGTNCDTSKLQFRTVAEVGFISVLAHRIQLGQDGNYFDYVKDGGQDVLFPATRFSIEVDLNKRNTFIFLYQPLRIESQAVLRADELFNGVAFPASTGINCLYNFPFYRFSYLRELTKNNEKFNFAIGGSLQIRNATISFESTDGEIYTDNRGIGPVPALKIRSRLKLNKCFYSELEADGIYAPVSYLNGSDNEIVGAILDASLRFGAEVNVLTNMFLNIRYLGGGATGTDTGDVWPGDGYVKNWLNILNISAGFVLKL